MSGLSHADHATSPPTIHIPRDYNAAHDLIERNLAAGRATKVAYLDDTSTVTYGELARRVNRFANAIVALGVQSEQRVLLCLLDSIDFPVAFLGCIKAGVVPVPVNTLLTPADYEYMLRDSRARVLVVSAPLLPHFEPLLPHLPHLKHVIASGARGGARTGFADFIGAAADTFEPAPTLADESAFWLYSSGSTGAPKGTVHTHSSMIQTAELFARPILGMTESDVMFSAAKLFFAYGLGNALSFPLALGATTVLMPDRPTPDSVLATMRANNPTVFCGVPTLFAAMLASPDLPAREELALRCATSAGESLPADLGRRLAEHFGIDVLDGIGSTEMLHVFLSNRPGAVRHGTTGVPVPGYRVRLVDDAGNEVPPGEIGELQVAGPTSALHYWNNRERSRQTFQGEWTSSGDKYRVRPDGYHVYEGRTDDMLKVSGQYVSPVEVESALIGHPAVLEAAVIARTDPDGLVKPMAFVVLRPGQAGNDELAESLRQHVKSHLAPFKYPRWIEFIGELPKTATGKIQRFKLRAQVQTRT